MLVAFLGFGLIGGSVARALRAADGWPDLHLVAWTPSGRGPRLAVADGVLDLAASSAVEAIEGADMIVIAAAPLDCLRLLDELGGSWRTALAPGVTITDVASTKAAICARAAANGLRFVGGHPMAGREASGYGAADADLFVGRPWVVTPPEPADDLAEARVNAVATACGAKVVRLGAAEHDATVAAISHLPLVVATALVEAIAGAPDWPVARGLAAGGWASMTRLARGDVEMGAGILATNGPAVADRLRDLRRVLDGWLTELETTVPDADRLRDRLASARSRLEADDADGGR
jgi:prephenate dehydrogenase